MNVHSLVPETSASANSATSAYLVVLCCLTAERVTLAVTKIRCSLSCSPNFDRCAISLSLHRPQDAVKLKAANSATSAYLVVLCCLTAERVTLAVPKIRCSLSRSPNFDRCAISLSLHRPQDAVKLNAANSATSAYCSYFYTAERPRRSLLL